jgi:hypothetical protein
VHLHDHRLRLLLLLLLLEGRGGVTRVAALLALLLLGVLDEDVRLPDLLPAGIGRLDGRVARLLALPLVELARSHHVPHDVRVDLQTLLRVELLLLQHRHRQHSVLNL